VNAAALETLIAVMSRDGFPQDGNEKTQSA
jgi:hypothetical protein